MARSLGAGLLSGLLCACGPSDNLDDLASSQSSPTDQPQGGTVGGAAGGPATAGGGAVTGQGAGAAPALAGTGARGGTGAAPVDSGAGADAPDAGAPSAGPQSDAGSEASDGGSAAAGTDAAQGSFDWTPGDYPPGLREQTYLEITGVPGQEGKTRGYKVHVPPSYDASVPAPVLFALHGYQQNAVMFVVDGTGFVDKSDEEGFILVMPNGLQEDLLGGSWNAGVCCGAAAAQKVDDVELMRAIYAELREHLNIDPGRVYATGLSNGGFMSHRLGCEAADLFTAIAPLAGSIGTPDLGAIGTEPDPDFESCVPSRPISVLHMHGNGDPIVPYAGMKPTLDHWASLNGCATTTSTAVQPESGGDTTCTSYDGCPSGIEVTGCTVQDGGHCWFGDESCGTGAPGIGNAIVGNDSDFLVATDAAWEFFRRLSR